MWAKPPHPRRCLGGMATRYFLLCCHDSAHFGSNHGPPVRRGSWSNRDLGVGKGVGVATRLACNRPGVCRLRPRGIMLKSASKSAATCGSTFPLSPQTNAGKPTMNAIKRAAADHPIHDLIAVRYSPYGFSSRPVATDDLRSLFEAARWAASSYNEQPWSFIVATAGETEAFARVLSCLVEANQAWAKSASALAICCTTANFQRNGRPNAAAEHDLGLAVGNLSLEAASRGLAVHPMIGILPDVARQAFAIPEGVKALTALAIGYAADPASLEEPLKQRDQSKRTRKPLAEFVFATAWGTKAKLAE